MKKVLLFILIGLSIGLKAQDSTEVEKPKNWTLSGYMKSLQTLIFFNNPAPVEDLFVQDNFTTQSLEF